MSPCSQQSGSYFSITKLSFHEISQRPLNFTVGSAAVFPVWLSNWDFMIQRVILYWNPQQVVALCAIFFLHYILFSKQTPIPVDCSVVCLQLLGEFSNKPHQTLYLGMSNTSTNTMCIIFVIFFHSIVFPGWNCIWVFNRKGFFI